MSKENKTDYSAPKDWTPQELNNDKDFLRFGKHKGKKVEDISADYLLFMHENGWVSLGKALLKACQDEKENGEKTDKVDENDSSNYYEEEDPFEEVPF